MMDRFIEKNKWEKYFDYMTKMAQGQQVEVEVLDLDLGDQIERAWTLLEGISYDPHYNIIYIHTDPLDHSVTEPQEVIVVEEGPKINSMLVKDTQGRSQIIKFRSLLRLEAHH